MLLQLEMLMPNWMDEHERTKKEEEERFLAEVRENIQKWDIEKKERERQYELIRGRVEPIYARLEALVNRANNIGFYLLVHKGEYSHEFTIYRYVQEETVRNIFSDGQLITRKKRAKGDERYLNGVADVTLYPKSEGLQIWFVEARIEMGWKNGKWYSNSEIEAKLRKCVGTVPYNNITEEKMLEIVKWISSGNEPIPHFNSVIPYEEWTPPTEYAPGGCLYSPWTYIIPLGILLLYLYLSSQR